MIYAAHRISCGPKLGMFVLVSAVIHMEHLMVIFYLVRPPKCMGSKRMSYLKQYVMGSGFDQTPRNQSFQKEGHLGPPCVRGATLLSVHLEFHPRQISKAFSGERILMFWHTWEEFLALSHRWGQGWDFWVQFCY